MPLHQGYTTRNNQKVGYYQWGNQKKYFYDPGNVKEREEAKSNAVRQAQAIYASGYKGN